MRIMTTTNLEISLWKQIRVRLTQVISNLISNAIKFTQEGVIRVNVEVKDNRECCYNCKG